MKDNITPLTQGIKDHKSLFCSKHNEDFSKIQRQTGCKGFYTFECKSCHDESLIKQHDAFMSICATPEQLDKLNE